MTKRFFLVVGHKNKRNTHSTLQADQLYLHMFAHLLIQRRQRLVQQQHLGLQDQCPRQRDPLPLAARQRMCRAAAIAS